MTQAIVLSGGVTHDFPALSRTLAKLLAQVGVDATIREDIEQATVDLPGASLLVVNMLRWRMLGSRYAEQATEHGLSLSDAARRRIEDWVRGGGAVLAMHAASICFDDWPQWKELIGARWVWGTSQHPPVGPVHVRVHPDRHPIVNGLPDSFDTDDEVYGFLDLADIVPLLSAEHSGTAHPLLWARTVGHGRVVHDALGHHLASYEPAVHRRIVQRSALWTLRRPEHEIAAL